MSNLEESTSLVKKVLNLFFEFN